MRACAVDKVIERWLGIDVSLLVDYINDPSSFHDEDVDDEDGMV